MHLQAVDRREADHDRLNARVYLRLIYLEQLVYLGGGKYLSYDKTAKTYPIVEEPEFVKCLLEYQVFYVLIS